MNKDNKSGQVESKPDQNTQKVDNEKEIIKWLVGSVEGKHYQTTAWLRCMKIQEFVKKVEKNGKIVAIVFSDNNIGFILD